jgi:hypothetical protein
VFCLVVGIYIILDGDVRSYCNCVSVLLLYVLKARTASIPVVFCRESSRPGRRGITTYHVTMTPIKALPNSSSIVMVDLPIWKLLGGFLDTTGSRSHAVRLDVETKEKRAKLKGAEQIA